MKIENKLTLTHIRLNKKRTALTVIGIIISVAMIVAVFIGAASFLNYQKRMIISTGDSAHLNIHGIDSEKLDILRNDSRIKSIGLNENGRADTSGVRVEGAKSLRHSTAYINWYDGEMFNQLYIEDMSGTFPKNNKEILINQAYIDQNGFDWKIGDTITLQTGRRHSETEADVFHITYTGEYKYGEIFDFYENRSFKIVAIINDKLLDYQINQMYSVCDENSVYSAHVQLNKVTPFSMRTINDIAKKLGIDPDNKSKSDFFINEKLLATHLCGSIDNEMFTKYLPMGAVILLIILVAAFMLIYNTFGMSIAERIRYLGMLSSVGATGKQKRNSSYFEGVVLGIIGIPIGLIMGIIVVLIGVKLINDAGFTDIPIKFVMPVWSVAAAVITSVLTIFLSLYAPSKKASQATAIEAIRQNNMVEIKNSKTPSIIKKLFGFEGVLAHKNLRRNGERSRLITVSIAVSSILFLCVNYYCSLTTALISDELNKPYQIDFELASYADIDQVLKDIENLDGVKNVYSINNYGYEYKKGDTDLITQQNNTTKKYKNLWDDVSIVLNYIDDDDFDALCEKNGIDPKPYYEVKNKRTKCVIMNNIDHKENGDKVFNENIIGGVLTNEPCEEYDEDDGFSREEQEAFFQELLEHQTFVDITGIVEYDKDNYACNLDSPRTISAYAPLSTEPAIVDIFNEYEGDYTLMFGVETDNHEKVCEDIKQYFDDRPDYAKDNSTWIRDSYGYALNIVQMNKVIKVFMYGFIALITMVTFVNIINTITTSIASRRRELAMIKSVGITPRGFKKMISLESIFYGTDSLLISIPISIAINILLSKIVGDGKIPYEFNFVMYLIVIIAVVLFVGLTMLYSIKKIKNDNIIENIKNDIL
ncbi:MAG: FtsX-like permease family protein [Acetobacter sp.]|nr:FtsX-like permease family protein [Bacteroides sp.]MCM1341815.1 FtsX-like permease family protein [Acetobacter sp.]MCM1433981.1 FtsX-like permease family protein [Clostridiales bacterium]